MQTKTTIKRLLSLLLTLLMAAGMFPNIALASGEGIEILSLTSTNANYGTYNTNTEDLHLKVRFKINAADATGGQIEVPLETTVSPYFANTLEGIIFSGTDGLDYIDFDSAYVADSTLIIPFTGGTYAVSDASFIVDLAFDHDTYDGIVAPATLLATYVASGVLGGTTSASAPLEVTCGATDRRFFHLDKTPVGDTVSDLDNQIPIRFDNTNRERWEFQLGTTFKMTLHFPEGTVVTSSAGAIGQTATSLTWEIDPNVSSNWNYYGGLRKIPVLNFPSGTFTDGTEITLSASAEYYLADGTQTGTHIINTYSSTTHTTDKTLVFKIIDGSALGMKDQAFTFTANRGGSLLAINRTDITNGRSSGYTNYIINEGTTPISNTCLTWINGIDENGAPTTYKANVHAVRVYNYVATFKTRWVATIIDDKGISHEVKGDLQAASSAGSSVTLTISATTNSSTSLKVAANEYLAGIKLYPQYEGTDALPPSAQMRVGFEYKGFTDCKDYKGRIVEQGTQVVQHAELTWTGQAPGDIREAYMTVYYTDPAASISTAVANKTSGAIYPGSEITLRISASNAYNNLCDRGSSLESVHLFHNTAG